MQELINFLENHLDRNKQFDDKLLEVLTDKGFTLAQTEVNSSAFFEFALFGSRHIR